jgi:hypothetical protein
MEKVWKFETMRKWQILNHADSVETVQIRGSGKTVGNSIFNAREMIFESDG